MPGSIAGIPRTDITRTEGVLRRMKAQLIAMDAVPGAANGVARAACTPDRRPVARSLRA